MAKEENVMAGRRGCGMRTQFLAARGIFCLLTLGCGCAATCSSAEPPAYTLTTQGEPLRAITSGNLLVAPVWEADEIMCWNWSDPGTPPKSTPSVSLHDVAVLADGQLVERVSLGLWHKMKDDPRYMDNPRLQEYVLRYKKLAEEEDRVVARAKYLQEIKKMDFTPLVIRNFAADQFSVIYKQEEAWYVDGVVNSHNGKHVAVWLAEEITVTNRFDDEGIRLGLVDTSEDSVRWVSMTRADAERGHRPHISDVVVSNDGKRIAVIGYNGQGGWVYVADTEQKKRLWEHRKIADTAAFHGGDLSPDGAALYAGGTLGVLYRFDGATGKEIAKWNLGGRIEEVKVSPDGAVVAVGAWGLGVGLCDSKSGKIVHQIRPPGAFSSIAFSPDGSMLAVVGDTAIWVYIIPAGMAARQALDVSATTTKGTHGE
jgi:hypothetical protein